MHSTVSISPASASSSSCLASIIPCCCIVPPSGRGRVSAATDPGCRALLLGGLSALRRRWRRPHGRRRRVRSGRRSAAEDGFLFGGARPEALRTLGERELLLGREDQAVPSGDREIQDADHEVDQCPVYAGSVIL